jgi:DNA-binding NarL/FixJ family response regulator
MEPDVVSVCSPDPLMLAGIARLLRDSAIGVASDADEAQVALVVVREIDDEAVALLTRVARTSRARVVAVVDQLRQSDLPVLVRCRVLSVLDRTRATPESLREVVDRTRWREALPADPTHRLLDQLERVSHDLLRPKGNDPVDEVVAPRERDLLRLLADGHDTAEIAKALAYSERTVKSIIQGVLTRLDLRNRAHAVAYATRAGLI